MRFVSEIVDVMNVDELLFTAGDALDFRQNQAASKTRYGWARADAPDPTEISRILRLVLSPAAAGASALTSAASV
jgi:hypothetical protein